MEDKLPCAPLAIANEVYYNPGKFDNTVVKDAGLACDNSIHEQFNVEFYLGGILQATVLVRHVSIMTYDDCFEDWYFNNAGSNVWQAKQ